MKELILGGARSGKSALAQLRALESGRLVNYVATAQARDEEMAARILRHQQERPPHWNLVEEPVHLAKVLREQAHAGTLILVDCLTLWLSNLLQVGEGVLQQEREALLKTMEKLPGHLILVSNETGLGVVPMGELTRRFVDEAGWLHQDVARRCDRVTLTVAGLPITLKGAHE